MNYGISINNHSVSEFHSKRFYMHKTNKQTKKKNTVESLIDMGGCFALVGLVLQHLLIHRRVEFNFCSCWRYEDDSISVFNGGIQVFCFSLYLTSRVYSNNIQLLYPGVIFKIYKAFVAMAQGNVLQYGTVNIFHRNKFFTWLKRKILWEPGRTNLPDDMTSILELIQTKHHLSFMQWNTKSILQKSNYEPHQDAPLICVTGVIL